MSVGPSPMPMPSGGFVHYLLRARDWQDQPEFGELCQWWRDGGSGVCALVGIGGAGKTAIADRFLQVLPGGYPEHPKVPKDRELATPARLFVFSFYDAPNPDTFFAELAVWLEGRAPAPRGETIGHLRRLPSYPQMLELLAAAGRCLLVLDGLEKMQNDGAQGGAFGQVLDGRLQDFVLRTTDGWLPQVSLLITSRFRLYDPLVARTWYYRQIMVEQLQPSAAVQLLRARGVHGTDVQLENAAGEQGFHALSVDLIGGYIAHFCGGDPRRFSSLTVARPEPVDLANPELDPRLAALREQERKFGRLTERYYQVLTNSDPAALSLLQRICLFRFGVEAKTFSVIFTGEGKEAMSGSALAALNEQQLRAKLLLLVEMRLVEVSKSQVYTVHPAMREGFLKTLDAETARLGHDAACEVLKVSLGGLPSWGSNPSDPATLDLLEEIVYHALSAGHVQEAWDVYWHRIGGTRNLLLRLGAYERGERICRAFSAGQPPQTAPVPVAMSEADRAIFIDEWAQYLQNLGQLAASASCLERQIEMRQSWEAISVGNRNLADVLLKAGRLTRGLGAAEEAVRLAERIDNAMARSLAYGHRAYARSLGVCAENALGDFRNSLHWQHESERKSERLLYRNLGCWHAQLLSRLGHTEQAKQLTLANHKTCIEVTGVERHFFFAPCHLLLAELECESSAARDLLHEAHVWALQHDAKESLCWSALVLARIELSTFRENLAEPTDFPPNLVRAAVALEEGLRLARECGYGIYHIDLLLVRARVALHEGRADDAELDVRVALNEGIHPPIESGFPDLLAATDPECLYAWGIAEGRHLLGEALLLQAAQKLGKAEFVPRRLDRLSVGVRDLIVRAREQLSEALKLWRKLRGPESEADINPRGQQTRRVIEQLDGGVLTEYPLEPMKSETETAPTPMPLSASAGFDVFLSHNSKDKPTVRQLGEELKKRGLTVWLDEWELVPGRPWQEALEGIVQTTRASAVLVGSDGIGPWQDREMRGCLSEFVDRGLPVIPVLLPGAPRKPDLPMFLKQFTWVDLRGGLTNDGIDRVQWGITGKKPGP